jgi:cholesterol oxidase
MINRLSSPVEDLKDHYEIVVVGSGYGGAIAASRLARAGRQVCLLERGKELRPGEYPDTAPEVTGEFQIDLPECHIGSRTGLYDLRVNEDISVFMGCGLGGTSLVNANVSLRADRRVFDDPCWPQALRNDLDTLVEHGYARAEEMLKPTPLPDLLAGIKKLEALADSASALPDGNFYRVPINVTFEHHVNHVGVEQAGCMCCGDCVSGCNYGAKNTVLMNYLPDARNHGAQIFTQVAVRFLERKEGRWLVRYQVLDTGRERFDAPPLFVSADIVVLAAGSLGSTEILLRSAANGLPLSTQLGQRFTGNGDVLAFSYNSDQAVKGIGWGQWDEGDLDAIGPCITGVIDLRNQPKLEQGMIIEEGSIPGALASVLPLAMASAAKTTGIDTDRGVGDLVKESLRELESLVQGAYRGAIQNTQTYLVMAHDDGAGQLVLEDDRLRIQWPGVGRQPIFAQIERNLVEATRPLGGTYLPNPIWSRRLGSRLIAVHPLGGCALGEDAERGVVNHKGQVFSGLSGSDTYEGLYVCDGAVIPRSIGVNPLLTISALSERCVALLARDRGWSIDYSLPSAPPAPVPAPTLGIEFTETMKGFVSTFVTDDYETAARQGQQDDSPFEFTLTIVSENLDQLLTDPAHEARMLGTVNAPALSPEPITVVEGTFNLLVDDPEQVRWREMRYRMQLVTEEGQRYWFTGFKTIHDDQSLDLWRDTTTLYATIREAETGPVVARGVLIIQPHDFMIQLSTLSVRGAADVRQRLEATARFGWFFSGALFDVYGGVVSGVDRLDRGAPPRKKRPLRALAPEIHAFATADDTRLRLTRYQGGTKGPVILSHGMGTSSRIFSIDTIETNLLEYLYAHSYDVWLLDTRVSIELPASAMPFSGDQIATHDYPDAVALVRQLTGCPSVQIVAHDFGSVTFFMAMLAGLEGVRSAVSSQVATHFVAPALTRPKSAPSTPDLFYEHGQLNRATRNALRELFGTPNTVTFEHLATMVTKGSLCTAEGNDTYLPYLDRLAIPITFIHGAENAYFLPQSTEKTFAALRKHNDPRLYQRHVVTGYGHSDCIVGENAARDVYPLILTHLEATS